MTHISPTLQNHPSPSVDTNQLMCIDILHTFDLSYAKKQPIRLNKTKNNARKHPFNTGQRGTSPSLLIRLPHVNKQQIVTICPSYERPRSPPPCGDRRGNQQGRETRRRGRKNRENKEGVGPSPRTVRRCFKRVGVSRLTSRHLLWLFLTSPDVAFFLNMFQCS